MRSVLALSLLSTVVLLAAPTAQAAPQALRHGADRAEVRAVIGAPAVSLAMPVTNTDWSVALSARLPAQHFAGWVGRSKVLRKNGAGFFGVGAAAGAFATGLEAGGGLAVDLWLTGGWRGDVGSVVFALSAPIAAGYGSLTGLGVRVPIQAEMSLAAELNSMASIGVVLSGGAVWASGFGVSLDANVGLLLRVAL